MITVPAGTFKALRIKHAGWRGAWEQYWYAPDIKFWVRYEDPYYMEELVSFHPASETVK